MQIFNYFGKNKRVIVVEFGSSSFTLPKSNLWS